MIRFVFTDHYWGVQLDGTTGEVLNVDKRLSDLIENIHDGSVLDRFFGTEAGYIKVVYTTILGVGLLLFTVTGFWLWYGPGRIRKRRKKGS